MRSPVAWAASQARTKSGQCIVEITRSVTAQRRGKLDLMALFWLTQLWGFAIEHFVQSNRFVFTFSPHPIDLSVGILRWIG